jgi:2-keto-4-pentenoate hydratase/2-oxohepta-3-ene-1,7-dioic acid hydratase in catechol pathway
MRLMSFTYAGRASYGVAEGDAVYDVHAVLGAAVPTLRALLAGPGIPAAREAMRKAPRIALQEVAFDPVIPDAGKVLCIGINYATHIAETGRPTPEKPMIFVRYPDSQVGHGRPMLRPPESVQYDFEGELAVIIGKAGRRIPLERALEHVAGYACYNDGSIRDWQRHTSQFTPGKTFPGTGGFGPWLVTTDEIPDPAGLQLETRLNGEVMQKAPVSDLVFDVPMLVAYCSVFTSLSPGDVIITGTPGGVGAFRKPPVWMKAGDTIEVEISGIGTLRNPIDGEKVSEPGGPRGRPAEAGAPGRLQP